MKAILYHKADLDGICSAGVALMGLNWDAVLFPYNYGEPVPDLTKYTEVFILDISIPDEELKKLMGVTKVILIDHHKSGRDQFARYWKEGLMGRVDKEDDRRAAVELTWSYFFPEQFIPRLLGEVGNWDIFRNRYEPSWEKTRQLQWVMRLLFTTPEEVANSMWLVLPSIPDLERWGKALDGQKQKELNIALSEATPVGDFLWVNQHVEFSAFREGSIATYVRKRNYWKVSLRSDTFNVRLIAEQLGGGGHTKASSFNLHAGTLPFFHAQVVAAFYDKKLI